ncbi:hypothetical protein AB0C07_08405 [Actinoplanes missouriensis]|uniref:hypothetical protein n=1 Tax=Actinoplanes missouriensis TaxID=1866 RepID=UPI0033F89653
MTVPESRAVRIVAQNLGLIQAQWGKGAKPDTVYGLSGLLRDLVVHGSLARAWGLVWPADKRPKFSVVAPDLNSLVATDRWPVVFHAQTAGFARPASEVRPGMHLWMPVALMRAATEGKSDHDGDTPEPIHTEGSSNELLQEVDRQSFDRIGEMSMNLRGAVMSGLVDQESVPLAPDSCYRRYTLKQFLESPCVIYRGRHFSRKDVVKTFANNFGSAHLDFHGDSAEYEMLIANEEWLSVTGRNPVLYEVLSIGQIIARSASAAMFRARVSELGLSPPR